MRIREANEVDLGKALGVDTALCRIFLTEPKQRIPHAALEVIGTLAAVVLYPEGQGRRRSVIVMESTCDYVSVRSGHNPPWELIPESGIVDRASANRAVHLRSNTLIVPDSSLAAHIRHRMAGFYRRHSR